jgi:hypothetical protein
MHGSAPVGRMVPGESLVPGRRAAGQRVAVVAQLDLTLRLAEGRGKPERAAMLV